MKTKVILTALFVMLVSTVNYAAKGEKVQNCSSMAEFSTQIQAILNPTPELDNAESNYECKVNLYFRFTDEGTLKMLKVLCDNKDLTSYVEEKLAEYTITLDDAETGKIYNLPVKFILRY